MSVASETGQGVRAYGQVLRLPGARSFVAAGILARFPRATLSLGIILLVSATTGSFASAGLVVAPLVGGMAIAAPLWSCPARRGLALGGGGAGGEAEWWTRAPVGAPPPRK